MVAQSCAVRFANRGLDYELLYSEGKLIYVTLNIPAPCPPRSVVLVNQGQGFASLFHLSLPSSLLVRDATAPTMSHEKFQGLIPKAIYNRDTGDLICVQLNDETLRCR